MEDSLGSRIKRYEAATNYLLTPRSCVVLRVDGKAFHTWTRGMDRPFDESFIDGMVEAARSTASEMMGFKLAYVQSDEASFLITDFDRHETQGWFGYELNKVVSITASLFTAHFNRAVSNPRKTPAVFDARAFVVPQDDAPNVFVWRCKDWHRNSVQMLGQSHFSHKELHGKKLADIHEMLHGIGVNWAELPSRLKNGTFITRDGSILEEQLNYDHLVAHLSADH